jgi:sirohydrochlorin ferrochelatase
MNPQGILILGHGTPSPEGTRSFLEIADLVRSLADESRLSLRESSAAFAERTPTVAVGFMEFASPTIADGAAELQRRGVTHIAAVPVFLSGVGHTANDIPPAVDAARTAVPGVPIFITRHVGSHPKIVELSALRFREAIAGHPEIPPKETLAVVVAHGSPEPEAYGESQKFAAARQQIAPVNKTLSCFSQFGAPLLKDVLPSIAEPGLRRIVVQPHLLLAGRFVDAIAATVAAAAAQHPEIEWIVTAPLGCHRLLADAVLELGTSEA